MKLLTDEYIKKEDVFKFIGELKLEYNKDGTPYVHWQSIVALEAQVKYAKLED